MGQPPGDGRSPAPIDRPILEYLQRRLGATAQVATATITDANGHLELRVSLAGRYHPQTVHDVVLTIRWYTNDDFAIHYREEHDDAVWECRWDRHPNPHNSRGHFHPPPAAATPGDDADWPTDYRDVLALVLETIEGRIADLWAD